MIQTLDFLTPVTDDPYEFGQIAAANSLSDVYAMGGTPVTVMNIVCFPSCDLPEEILARTLEGGLDKINESGATLVGGHSVDDAEFKYGLSVTGVVHPKAVVTNSGAQTGDFILLTKPVGTGVLSTAVKAQLASLEQIREAAAVMSRLNKTAAETMAAFHPTACTDVTGFGLAGHLLEAAKGSKKAFHLFTANVPLLSGALEFAGMGLVPAGAHNNRRFFKDVVQISDQVEKARVDLMFDPQTSGGLLVFLPESKARLFMAEMKNQGENAWQIGQVVGESGTGFLTMI